MGISGYAMFAADIHKNILDGFPTHDSVGNIARAFQILYMLVSFPSKLSLSRVSLNALVYGPTMERTNIVSHVVAGGSILSATIGMAIATCDLPYVMILTGGFSSVFLAIIFPSLCQIQINGFRNYRTNWPFYSLVFFGVAIFALTIVYIIENYTSSGQC